MTRTYKLISLQEATPGMVLSDNLIDRHGKVLLSRKTVLDEKLLESLRRYDIEMIPVMDPALTGEQEATLMANDLAQLDRLFRKGDYGNPAGCANDELLEWLRHYRRGEGE